MKVSGCYCFINLFPVRETYVIDTTGRVVLAFEALQAWALTNALKAIKRNSVRWNYTPSSLKLALRNAVGRA